MITKNRIIELNEMVNRLVELDFYSEAAVIGNLAVDMLRKIDENVIYIDPVTDKRFNVTHLFTSVPVNHTRGNFDDKVAIIKQVREETGASLKDSKEFVEKVFDDRMAR